MISPHLAFKPLLDARMPEISKRGIKVIRGYSSSGAPKAPAQLRSPATDCLLPDHTAQSLPAVSASRLTGATSAPARPLLFANLCLPVVKPELAQFRGSHSSLLMLSHSSSAISAVGHLCHMPSLLSAISAVCHLGRLPSVSSLLVPPLHGCQSWRRQQKRSRDI